MLFRIIRSSATLVLGWTWSGKVATTPARSGPSGACTAGNCHATKSNGADSGGRFQNNNGILCIQVITFPVRAWMSLTFIAEE